MTTIPLTSSYLCVQCDIITDNPTSCPKCLNTGLLALAKVLNRPSPDLEGEEFYDLMQTYRHTPIYDQPATIAAFEAIKLFIKGE